MVEVLSLVLISVPIFYSLKSSIKIRGEIKSSRDFFLFHEGLVSAKLRNSITASNLSVASVIFSFLGLGFAYKIAAIVSPITWLIGFLILIRIYPKIKGLSTRTLHGYLSYRYKTPVIGYIASIATIIGFLGTYGIEILVSTKITSALFPSIPPLIIALILSSIVAIYTSLGGFKAATQIDTSRLRIIYVGVLIGCIYSFYIAYINSESFDNIKNVIISENFGFSNLTLLFLISLSILNIPWQLVDMSIWQRLVACESSNDIKKGLKQSVWIIGISWFILILLGISLYFFPNFESPENGDFTTPFLSYLLKNPYVFAIFAAGCFAAMMSTADSLLIASVQTLTQDIVYPNSKLSDKSVPDENLGLVDKKILSFGKSWVLILGIISPVIIYLSNLFIPGILDLFFIILSAQLTLLSSIIVAIYNRNSHQYRVLAMISIILGLLTSFGMFANMLFNPSMETFLWAPIISLAVSLVPWIFSIFISSK